jgi:hypothetical protein
MALTAADIKPDALYVCMDSFMSGPHAAVANEGEELRGSDPRVLAAPHLFVPAGTPRSEWTHGPFATVNKAIDANSAQLTEARKVAFERAAKANTVKLEAPKIVTLKSDWMGELDGAPTTIRKGSKVASTHSLVLAHPELFS